MTIENALRKVLGFGPKEFCQKAIEGGWIPEKWPSTDKTIEHRLDSFRSMYEDETGDMYRAGFDHLSHRAMLDPLAWAAVGITEGWGTEYNHSARRTAPKWKQNMHRLIYALAEETV